MKRNFHKRLMFIANLICAKPRYEYAWDPKHENRPEGSGWEQTSQGWSRNTGEEEKDEKKWYGKNKDGEYYYDAMESEGDDKYDDDYDDDDQE